MAACNRNGEETPVEPDVEEQATPEPPPVDDNDEEEEYEGLDIDEILEQVEDDHPLAALHAIQARFPLMSGGRSDGQRIQGGHINMGINSSDPAPGVLNAVFWTSGVDADLMGPTGIADGLIRMTPTMMMGQQGPATYEVDRDRQVITVTLNYEIYWHDGVRLTLNDLVFAHEVIAHAEYPLAGGTRFGLNQQRIVGIMDYHNGDADYISGLVLSDCEMILEFHFTEFPPTLLYFGIWTTPYPRHIFGDIPIEDHPGHERSRVNPIGWGPFVVQNIVAGEAVYAVANENFWAGRPHLDSVTTRIVHPSMIPSMMLNGDLDVVPFLLQDYPDMPNPTNFMYLGDVANTYNWVAFNLGDWNPETGELEVYDMETARMGNPNLRRAMAYASNEELLTEGLFNGLRFPATSFIPPGHSTFLDPTLRGFPYNPELAMELLDEAGFTVGDDGWRTFPDGSELILHFVISGQDDPSQVTVATHYAQAWEDVGLQVYIDWVDWTAKTVNIFQADNWDWDVTTAAWGAGANPDPNVLWGDTSNNRARYLNPTLRDHLVGFGSDDAWDLDWLIGHFHEWQHMMVEFIPAFPTNWRISLVAVNNRVGGWFIGLAPDEPIAREIGLWHNVYVTADEPYRH